MVVYERVLTMVDTTKLKSQLEDRLRELTHRAEIIDEDLRQPDDDDWEEAATDIAEDEVSEEVGDVMLDEIDQIKRALKLIESGRYGKCEACGDEISAARLAAIPHATKCVNCA